MKRIFYFIIFAILLFLALTYWSLSSTDKTFERNKVLNLGNIDSIDFRDYDSVTVAASYLYEPNYIKEIMQGEQYRDVWAAPINVPVLYLDTLFGGVTIIKEGGGNQTHSLKLLTKDSIEYALRSINKDPKPLIPEFAKKLGLENIVVDGISAQHPYGALLSAKLSEAVGILHTNPKVYFLPKQKKLDTYNDKFGNRLFLLEYETEGDANWTSLSNIDKIVDTEDLQELKEDLRSKLHIDKRTLIRARLFDFIIGDWDRHAKQWGFAIQKTDNGYLGIPIPGDRDNAFFDTDGIIPSLITNQHVEPKLRPFEDDIDFMEGLVYPFDRYFLLNTDESLFTSEAKAIQNMLTDQIIYDAFKVWPKNIRDITGTDIAEKIISRRGDLIEYAKKFKAEIDRQGEVQRDLKGSEDEGFDDGLIRCFECN